MTKFSDFVISIVLYTFLFVVGGALLIGGYKFWGIVLMLASLGPLEHYYKNNK